MYRIGLEKDRRDDLPEENKKLFLAAKDNLFVSPRDLKVLVVDGETASWMVMPQSEFYFLQQLRKPKFMDQFIKENEWVSQRQLMDLVEQFYSRGLVEIDARCLPHCADMQKKPQESMSTFFIEVDTQRENAASKVLAFETVQTLAERIFKDFPQDEFLIVLSSTNLGKQWDYLVKIIIHFNELATQNKTRPHYIISGGISEVGKNELEYAVNQKVSFILRVSGVEELKTADSGKIMELFSGEKANFTLDVRISDPDELNEACQLLKEREIHLPRLNFAEYDNLLDSETGLLVPGRVEEFSRKFSEVFGQAIEHNKESKQVFLFSDLNFMIESAIVSERRSMCMKSPCGAGLSIMAFDTDGFIYPCDTMIGIPQLALGNINDIKTIPDAVLASPIISGLRNRKVDSLSKCSVCPWKHLCSSGCPTQAFKAFGNVLREDPFCRFYQAAYEEILWRLAEEPATMSLQDLLPPPSGGAEEPRESSPPQGECPVAERGSGEPFPSRSF
ncbi:MAG: SPASM domain-containing protein [bacterium]